MEDWQQYFDRMNNYHFKVTYQPNSSNDTEDMYQAFKERLIAELAVSTEELLNSGELFDTTK